MQPTLPSNVAGARSAIDAWTRSPALHGVLEAFGARLPEGLDLASRLDRLVELSERWDYRGGRERNLVEDPALDSGTSARVLRAAAELGLVGETDPAGTHYHHVLILGGLARACIARPLHAAKLLRDGRVAADAVVGLGGYRPLQGDELRLVEQVVAAKLDDEFDVMDAGIRRAFALDSPIDERGEGAEAIGGSWRVRGYRTVDGLPVQVVAAPSTEPGVRRANTADTYLWFATQLARLEAGQRLLLVTSDIYVPYQHADALRMLALPYGVEVDTVGIRPGALDARLEQEFRPHNYLQELRSTILAFRSLNRAAGGAGGGERAYPGAP